MLCREKIFFHPHKQKNGLRITVFEHHQAGHRQIKALLIPSSTIVCSTNQNNLTEKNIVYVKSDKKYPVYRKREQGKEYAVLTAGASPAHGLQYLSEQFPRFQIRLILEKHCPLSHYLVCNIGVGWGGVVVVVKM